VKAIVVQKRNGEFEDYNENKLRHSLQRSGTEDEVVEILLKKVRTILHNGISTKEIFDFVFKELKKDKEP
jgi:transcriptional regulator NrdR family protein